MGRKWGKRKEKGTKPTMTRRGQRSKRRDRTKGTTSEKGGGHGEEKEKVEEEEEGGERSK